MSSLANLAANWFVPCISVFGASQATFQNRDYESDESFNRFKHNWQNCQRTVADSTTQPDRIKKVSLIMTDLIELNLLLIRRDDFKARFRFRCLAAVVDMRIEKWEYAAFPWDFHPKLMLNDVYRTVDSRHQPPPNYAFIWQMGEQWYRVALVVEYLGLVD